jgi:putative ABC transport system ATP-binding protein
MVVSLKSIHRTFQLGSQQIRALEDVSFDITEGEFVRITGSSGSGKSTLLNLVAGLDTPTSGVIQTRNGDLSRMTEVKLASWRANQIGMVFQGFNLIAHLTALQNVEMGMMFLDIPKPERLRRARAQLIELGLQERLEHYPATLSGGEQQRVSLARALAKKPEILLADEPSGNLDLENTHEIETLFAKLNREGLTIILVTHDRELSVKHAHRTFVLDYGRLADVTIHNEFTRANHQMEQSGEEI